MGSSSCSTGTGRCITSCRSCNARVSKSIEDVAAFLNVPPEKTVKMLLYQADGAEKYIAVCIRGDLTVNEIKLRTILGAKNPDYSR